jgi:hypothetical protein
MKPKKRKIHSKVSKQDKENAKRLYKSQRASLKRKIKRDYHDGWRKDGKHGYTDGNWYLALKMLESLGPEGIANAIWVARQMQASGMPIKVSKNGKISESWPK